MNAIRNTDGLVATARTGSGLISRGFGGGWIFGLLIALILLFTILRPSNFFTLSNFSTLAIDASILLVLAIGQTFVIVTAGIDLSVGSVLVFSSVVGAQVMLALSGESGSTYGTTDASWGVIAIGAAAAILAGAVWGFINGILVAKARIPALIVTLGTLGMALGFAQLLTNGVDVRGIPERLVSTIGLGNVLGIPVLVIIATVIALIGAFLLHVTRFGLWTFAVGSNTEAARRSGIATNKHLVKVYTLAGLLAGIGGVMSIARFGTTTIGGHSGDNLAAIAAVVLGGTSLFGGVGTIIGSVVGVGIPIVLLNGFVIMGVAPFWQTIAVGAVLVAAVWIDQLKRRSRLT
jgi:ribose transport system permease protein